jgi:hypothetical protein
MSSGDLGSLEWTVRARLDKLDGDIKEGESKLERFRARAERPINVSAAASGSSAVSSRADSVSRSWDAAAFSEFKAQEKIARSTERLSQIREQQVKGAELDYKLSQTSSRKTQAEILRSASSDPGISDIERMRLETRANRVESGGQAFGWFQRFLAVEGVRIGTGIADARAKFGGAETLAGNDLSAQLKAQLEYRQNIVAAAPFGLGQLGNLISDPHLYEQTAIQASTNLSEAQDRQISQRQSASQFYQEQSFKTLQETTPNPFARRSQEIAYERQIRIQDIQKNRESSNAAALSVKNAAQASAVADAQALRIGITADDLADPSTLNYYANSATSGATSQQVRSLYARYQSASNTFTQSSAAAQNQATSAINALPGASAVQNAIEAGQHQAVISGAFYAAQSNIASGGGRKFEGALSDIQGQNSSEFFGAKGDPENQWRALVAGASRIYRLFGETGLELTKRSVALESSTAVTQLRSGGNYLAANLAAIESDRQRQQIEASQYSGAPGYGRLVSAINLNASAQGEQSHIEESKRLDELNGTIASLTKQLQHDPLGAQLATIESNRKAALEHLDPLSSEYETQTKKYGLQSAVARQQFNDAGSLESSGMAGNIAVNQLRAQHKDKSAQALAIRNQAEQKAEAYRQSGRPDLAIQALREGQSAEAALGAQFAEENLGSVTGGYGLKFGPGFKGKWEFYEPPSAGVKSSHLYSGALGDDIKNFNPQKPIGGAAANAQSASLGNHTNNGMVFGPPKPAGVGNQPDGPWNYIGALLQGIHDVMHGKSN